MNECLSNEKLYKEKIEYIKSVIYDDYSACKTFGEIHEHLKRLGYNYTIEQIKNVCDL